MPLDTEDVQAQDISGDPPPTTPMSQKQVAGAQKATANRTQLGAQPKAAPVDKPDKTDQQAGRPEGKGMSPGQEPPSTDKSAAPLGGLAQTDALAYKAQADAQLRFDPRNFNPLNAMDWLKQAAELPVETYQMGRHVWDAYFGAFLNTNAISYSIQSIQAQDAARTSMLLKAGEAHPGAGRGGLPAVETANAAQVPSQMGSDLAATALEIGANPFNVLPFGQLRGAQMIAMMMTPTIAQAVLGKGDPRSELLWGTAAAAIFGGKLPPSVEGYMADSAPGALRLLDKIGATQRAQDAMKVAAQNSQTLIDQLMKMGPAQERQIYAPAFQQGMKALSKEEHSNLSKAMMEKYGTLDRDTLIPMMVKAGESQASVARVWTKLMKMPRDLMYEPPTEAPLINPVSDMEMMPEALRKEVDAGHQWILHVANQAMTGPAGHAGAPAVSRFYSLIGHQNTNDMVVNQLEAHLRRAAGPEADNPTEQGLLMRALNGDHTAYLSLSPGMKYVNNAMRMAAAGLRLAAKDSGYSEDFVNNYWPRTPMLVKDAKGFVAAGARLLTSQVAKHRTLAARTIDALDHEYMQVEQRYPTLASANEAQQRLRTSIVNDIIDGTPLHEITGVPETEFDTIERIRTLASDPATLEAANTEAKHFAEQIAPDFSNNPFDSFGKIKAQLRSITSHRAINDLLNSTGKDGKSIAVMRPMNDKRAFDMLTRSGYRQVAASGFQNVLVSSEYAALLERAAQVVAKGGRGVAQTLAEIEGTAVATIMYSPRIHGMNMAARLGVLGTLHPIEVARYFKAGLIQKVGEAQVGPDAYRMEAWNAGVVPPHPGMSGFADKIGGTLSNLTGDSDLMRTPLVNDLSKAAKGIRDFADKNPSMQILGSVKNALWGKQEELWSWVSDFGVMAYHIEKAAALRGGVFGFGKMTEEEATQYAARRANSWMGHVLPEDTNPAFHALAKTAAFAPNWWRTWGELLTGYYKRAGWGWSADTIKYVVQNEVRTALAAVAFQQLSANALNVIFSGHSIYQNDPGNWGKVEITAPWATDILNKIPGLNLGIDAKTGRNAKGQKLTLENPVARQMTDTEQMLGLLTSSPNWNPSTLVSGASAFAAGRVSPVVSALGALGNLDVYSSIASDSPRAMDPTHDTPFGNPGFDALTSMLSLLPFSYITNQIQQSMIQGQNSPSQEVQGPFGLPIPKVVSDTLKGVPGDLMQSFLIGLTGINPPYMRASKSFGIEPPDDVYQSVNQIDATYTQNMNALSTSSLTGQMTPSVWLAAYRTLSTQRADQLQFAFKHAPEYNYGPLGLTNDWESLYDKAAVNGVTDTDKLFALQQQWRADHSSADYAAVQSELRVNDQKYPMLAVYHKALDAYDNWQFDYAKQNNIDLATLRADLNGYGQAYGDRNATNAWLLAHPDIAPYEAAKKAEFENGSSTYGEAGLMFALFFSPTAAEGYLNASGQSVQQVEAATWSETVPTAP